MIRVFTYNFSNSNCLVSKLVVTNVFIILSNSLLLVVGMSYTNSLRVTPKALAKAIVVSKLGLYLLCSTSDK